MDFLGGARNLLDSAGQALSRFANPDRSAPQQPEAIASSSLDEAALLEMVKSRYAYARDAKVPMLETWATSLAFVVGDQWRSWNNDQRRLVRSDRIPSWRIMPVYNQLPGVIDTAAAKLARARQLPQTRPENPDDPESLAESERSTHALKGWWHREQLDTLEHEANVNRIMFGAAFWHLYWDPAKAVRVPQQDPWTGRTSTAFAPVGDLQVEILTAFDVFPQPCEHFRQVQWVIVARRKPLSWFRAVFGEKGRMVTADRGEASTVFSGLIPGSSLGEAQSSGAPDGDQMATLLIYYGLPGPGKPAGQHCMVAGDVYLWGREQLPLEWEGARNPMPVKPYIYRFVPTRMWPKGLVEECIGPQRELNRGLGNLSELFRYYRSPKRWIDKAWGIEPDAITSAPDEVVEGNFRGVNPAAHVESPPALPAWISQYPQLQRDELRHVAGQQEVSEGGVPAGVTAATAINLLQQADNTRMSAPALLGKGGLEDVTQHALIVMAARYREPRRISVPERNGQQVSQDLTGEQLGRLEVYVELTDGLQDSDVVRQQQVADWFGPGGAAQLPLPVQTQLLRESGRGWMAHALEQSNQVVQEQQAQQAAQAAEAQAAAAAEAGSQQNAQQQQQADEADAQRQHELHKEALKGLTTLAAAQVRQPAVGVSQ